MRVGKKNLPAKATSKTGVQSKGTGLPSKVTQTWPPASWQKPARRPTKAAFAQTRTLFSREKVVLMAPTVGLVQKGW